MQGQTSEAGSTDIAEMQTKALEGLKEARGTVEEFAKQNPRVAIGIALGVGFVLGGGLTPRLLFGLGAIVARNFAKDYARNQLGSMTRNFLGGADEAEEETTPRKRRAASAAT